jgi:hypothetical protein
LAGFGDGVGVVGDGFVGGGVGELSVGILVGADVGVGVGFVGDGVGGGVGKNTTKEHGVCFYVRQGRAYILHKVEPDEHFEQCEVQPLVPKVFVSGVLKTYQITSAKALRGPGALWDGCTSGRLPGSFRKTSRICWKPSQKSPSAAVAHTLV